MSATIGNLVTRIGEGTFHSCAKLTSAIIGNSVTSIGDNAFYNCDNLIDIVIPDSVISIGDYAFYSCSSLKSATIGNLVTSIGEEAFHSCVSLTSVTIGKSIIGIGSSAFEACYRLVEVYNLSSLKIQKGSSDSGYVGYYAKDIYESIDSPSKLDTDDNGYIIYTVEEVASLIGYIGDETELTLPTNITQIYQYAFYDCANLTSVVIGNSITYIDSGVFSNSKSLITINYTGTQEEWEKIEGIEDSGISKNVVINYNYEE